MNIAAKQILLRNNIKKTIYNSGTVFHLYIRDQFKNFQLGNITRDTASTDVTIDWGDGTIETFTSDSFSPSHQYQTSGVYILQLSDDISSFKFKYNNDTKSILATYHLGKKIKTLQSTCFQNQAFQKTSDMEATQWEKYIEWYKNIFKDIIVNAYVTSIGSYAITDGGFMCKNLRFVDMTQITGVMFYGVGLASVQNLYFDKFNTNSINSSDYLHGWAHFMQGYNTIFNYKSITFTNMTCNQIKSMSYFPWNATASNVTIPIYFIGTDGILDKNGNVQQGLKLSETPVPTELI